MLPYKKPTRPKRVKKYYKLSVQYLENAIAHMLRGEYNKASEFLWGSAAEAIKAVAARKRITLRRHEELGEFVAELAKELEEPRLYEGFRAASRLHSNFYEASLRHGEFLEAFGAVRCLVERLLELAFK